MRPFTVTWDADKLSQVYRQLQAYKMPRLPAAAGWRYGCDPAFLSELCAYWLDRFDEAAAAAELNRFPQIMASVEGFDIHAVHVVGEAGGRRPLLLAHGWPGSVYEFWNVIEPLAFPTRHGGRVEDAFDLVIPAIPGFGFSSKPTSPIGPRTTARLFNRLMHDLGYTRYRAQGGDWGSGIAAWLGHDHAASLEAIHINYLITHPCAEPVTEEEKTWRRAFDDAQARLSGYAHLQGTRPLSLGYAMADTPVAQLAWIIERFHDWADLRDTPFEAVFSKDQLLTNALFYIITDSFTTSTWYYAGALNEGGRRLPEGGRVSVPTVFAAYHDGRLPIPSREWVERGYNLVQWKEMPRGGHFAAMEVPDLFVEDVRAWGRI